MRGTSTLRNMGMSSTLYGPTGDPLEAPADPELVQRERVNFTATGEASLTSAPTSGNTLLAFAYGPEASLAEPAGFTVLVESYDASNGYMLAAKVSAGTEQNITMTGASRMEYQEWSGMAALGSIYDSGESIENMAAAATSWDPASVVADQQKAVYLALLGMGNTTGTVTSDWTGADDTYNSTLLLGCHKIVTDGSAFDTTITWTTSRPVRGALFVLRGEAT
jgi:hypothetical protein